MLDTRSLVSALALILTIGILLHFVNWRIHRTSEGALACCERSVCFDVVHLACTRITQTETQRKRNVRR